jgi:hypothetical protein
MATINSVVRDWYEIKRVIKNKHGNVNEADLQKIDELIEHIVFGMTAKHKKTDEMSENRAYSYLN